MDWSEHQSLHRVTKCPDFAIETLFSRTEKGNRALEWIKRVNLSRMKKVHRVTKCTHFELQGDILKYRF